MARGPTVDVDFTLRAESLGSPLICGSLQGDRATAIAPNAAGAERRNAKG